MQIHLVKYEYDDHCNECDKNTLLVAKSIE